MDTKWQKVTAKIIGGQGACTERLPVFGGWIVRTFSWTDGEEDSTETAVFVPDAKHEWEIIQ